MLFYRNPYIFTQFVEETIQTNHKNDNLSWVWYASSTFLTNHNGHGDSYFVIEVDEDGRNRLQH